VQEPAPGLILPLLRRSGGAAVHKKQTGLPAGPRGRRPQEARCVVPGVGPPSIVIVGGNHTLRIGATGVLGGLRLLLPHVFVLLSGIIGVRVFLH